MKRQVLTPFEFHRNGYANRRDPDTVPRVLVTSVMGLDVAFHVAGDTHLRTAPVTDVIEDHELIAGMDPADALKLGIEYQRQIQPPVINIVRASDYE